jgi:hypothetical protein
MKFSPLWNMYKILIPYNISTLFSDAVSTYCCHVSKNKNESSVSIKLARIYYKIVPYLIDHFYIPVSNQIQCFVTASYF